MESNCEYFESNKKENKTLDRKKQNNSKQKMKNESADKS